MSEYDESARRLIALFNRYGEGVRQVSPTVGRATVDFDLGTDHDVPLLERAAGGTWGSSVVIDTTNDEIVSATMRYGKLDLPDSADEFVAMAEAAEVVENTDPPHGVTTPGVSGSPPTSVRKEVPGITVRLRQMGGDILHVVLNKRVGVDEFIPWFQRLDPAIREAKPDITAFATDVGGPQQ